MKRGPKELTGEGKHARNRHRRNNRRQHITLSPHPINRTLQSQRYTAPAARLAGHPQPFADSALHGVVVFRLVVKVPAGCRVGHLVRVFGPEPQLGGLTPLHCAQGEAHGA